MRWTSVLAIGAAVAMAASGAQADKTAQAFIDPAGGVGRERVPERTRRTW
jgi:hypothetical protein